MGTGKPQGAGAVAHSTDRSQQRLPDLPVSPPHSPYFGRYRGHGLAPQRPPPGGGGTHGHGARASPGLQSAPRARRLCRGSLTAPEVALGLGLRVRVTLRPGPRMAAPSAQSVQPPEENGLDPGAVLRLLTPSLGWNHPHDDGMGLAKSRSSPRLSFWGDTPKTK